MLRVTIIGLGFVGLTLTSFLSSKKIKVIGIDSNQKKIDKLGKGCTDFFEPDLEKFLKKGEKFQEGVNIDILRSGCKKRGEDARYLKKVIGKELLLTNYLFKLTKLDWLKK